ncbi:hypothetical protein LZ31DRAFT_548220, partial [Colletotrichum somersetense]
MLPSSRPVRLSFNPSSLTGSLWVFTSSPVTRTYSACDMPSAFGPIPTRATPPTSRRPPLQLACSGRSPRFSSKISRREGLISHPLHALSAPSRPLPFACVVPISRL